MLVELQELRPVSEIAYEISFLLVQRRGDLMSMLDGNHGLEIPSSKSVQLVEGVERVIDNTFGRVNSPTSQVSTKMAAPDKVGVRVVRGFRISK